jgi:hypothetical protein
MRHPRLNTLLVVGLLLLTVGCVTSKPADFVAPEFRASQVEQLAVLPVLDHRIERQGSIDLDAQILPIAERELTRLGYAYTIVRDRHAIERIERGDFEHPSPGEIAALEPSTSRWLLALVVESSASSLTFGSTGTAELTGYLFDRQARVLVWKNKELGRVGQGGLLGMALKGMMEGAAIEQAAMQMFRALPDRQQQKP